MKSNLQIISGKYRGKKLLLPQDARPTQNMARGALFNMLNEILDKSERISVWDAFGGSGAFGIECLSRYDKPMVVFTDTASSSIETLKKNLNSVNESQKINKCCENRRCFNLGIGKHKHTKIKRKMGNFER